MSRKTLYEWMWHSADWRISSGAMKGQRYTLDAFPMVKDVIKDESLEQAIMKSSQVAASELMSLAKPFYHLDVDGINWGVMFPTQGAMRDFFKTRFKGALAANKYVGHRSTAASETNIDAFGRTVFLRYTTTDTAIATFDADGITVDEVDLHNQAMLYGAKTSRTQGAMGDIYWIEISTPTYPNVGIHRSFLASDQMVWLVRCGGCGKDNDLTEKVGEWDTDDLEGFLDGYLGQIKRWQDYHIPCSHCGRPLETVQPMEKLGDRGGRWVARYPDRHVRGRHMQIWNRSYRHGTPHVLRRVRAQFLEADTPVKLRRWWNYTVGVPYVPKEGRLSTDAVERATTYDYEHAIRTVGGYPHLYHIDGERVDYLGIDVRDQQYHIWGLRRISDNRFMCALAGWVKLSGEVLDIWRKFGTPGFCIDNEPDTNESRQMVKAMDSRGRKAFRGKLASNIYRVWQESSDRHLRIIHRDKVMEEVKAKIEACEWVIPHSMWNVGAGIMRTTGVTEEEETVLAHFRAPVMVPIEDDKTGNVEYGFPKNAMGGTDPHFYMAACFAHVATAACGLPSGVIVVPR